MNTDELNAYLDGELSASEKTRVDAELSERPELRAELDALASVDRALETLPSCTPSGEFTDRVVAAAHRRRRGRLVTIVAPFAALAAAVLLGIFLWPETPRNGSNSADIFSEEDHLDYVWEADEETYSGFDLSELEDEILAEIAST